MWFEIVTTTNQKGVPQNKKRVCKQKYSKHTSYHFLTKHCNTHPEKYNRQNIFVLFSIICKMFNNQIQTKQSTASKGNKQFIEILIQVFNNQKY